MHPHVRRGRRRRGGGDDAGEGVGHDPERHADPAEVRLEHLRRLDGLLQLGLHMHLDLAPERRAGRPRPVAMLARQSEVEFIGREVRRIAPEVVRVRPGVADHEALEDDVVEAFVVEGMGEAEPSVEIVEGRLAVVHPQQEHPHGLVLRHPGTGVAVHPLHLVGRQVAVRRVDLAAHQRQHPRAGLHHRAAPHILDRLRIMRPAHEMPGEALQVEADAGLIGRRVDHIGARARVIRRQPGRAPVVVDDVRGDDAGVEDGDDRHRREEGAIGLVEDEADRAGIGGGDILRLEDRGEGRGRGAVQRHQPAEAPDHILGGHGAAIVEADALAQPELPGQAIGGDGVALGEPWDEVIALVAIQPVIGVQQDELARHVEDRVHVEGGGQRIAPDQRPRLGLGPRCGQQQHGQDGGDQAHRTRSSHGKRRKCPRQDAAAQAPAGRLPGPRPHALPARGAAAAARLGRAGKISARSGPAGPAANPR